METRTAPEATATATTGRAVHARRRVFRWLYLELAVVLAAAGTVFLHLRSTFFLANDDFYQFAVADADGLSWEYLSLNVFGHFGPVNRLGHLAFLRWAGLDLTVGAVASSVLVLLLLLTVLWLCRELRFSPVRRLVVLAGTGFSITVLETAVWMDGALHVLPALAATYAVVAAHLRALNTRRWYWHVVSVLLFAVGLLVQVRPAFALPLIVLVDLLLVPAGRPWKQRFGALRRSAVPLAAMVAIGAVAAVLLRLHYATEGGQSLLFHALWRTMAGAFTSVLFPSLVGWVPTALPSAGSQAVLGLLIAAAAVALVLRRRANAGPLLFVLGAFVLYYGFLVFSPILLESNVEFTALRLTNLVYLTVPTLLGLASLGLRRTDRTAATPVPAGESVRRGVLVVTAVLAVTGLVVTGSVYTDQRWERPREAHDYLAAVAEGEPEWTSDDVTVLPLRAPWSVAEEFLGQVARHESLLPLYSAGWSPRPAGGRPVVLDTHGEVVPVLVETLARGTTTPGPESCLRTTREDDTVVVQLQEQAAGAPLFAAVTYEYGRPGDPPAKGLAASADAQQRWGLIDRPWPLPAGRHTIYLPLIADPVVAVGLTELTAGITLCVTDVAVVRPLFEHGGVCTTMTPDGALGPRVPCPPREPGP